MELKQLRYFIGVMEAGSLLKAAGRLHVAQPALGQQIAALEEELGARLFERSSRGMHPTPAGNVFLEHAKVVLDDIERARSAVQERQGAPEGEVAIGLPTTVALAVTIPIVSACRERLPNVRLRVVEAYSGFLKEWLQAGRLDLAVLFGEAPDPSLFKQALLDEELALVSRPGSRGVPERVKLAQVAAAELVLPSRDHGLRRIIDATFDPLGSALKVVAEIDSLPSVKRAVEAGIGSTILPLAAVAVEVSAGTLVASAIDDVGMIRRVVLARNVSRPATQAARAVASLTTDLIRNMVQTKAWPGRWIGH